MSIGTGIGTVLFYDVRVNKFLFDENESSNLENHLTLQTNGGWIVIFCIYFLIMIEQNLKFSKKASK